MLTARPAVVAFFAVALAATLAVADDDERERDWRFVRAMLFDAAAATPRVERWASAPAVAFSAERQTDVDAFIEVMRTLEMILAPTDLRFTVDYEAFDILVSVKPPETYRQERAAFGCGENGDDLLGVACPKVEADGRITAAVVLADNDWHPEALRSTLMEEMFHALGVPNHSTVESTSLLYDPPEGRPALQRVSRLDAQLLLFLYMHLRPGDDEAAVRRAFDRHWADMTLPPLSGPLVRGDLDPLPPPTGRHRRRR